MSDVLEKIIRLNDTVLRNTVSVNPTFNAFDDLSEDARDWEDARQIADFSDRFSLSDLQYHAIDYVFHQREWQQSRFSDGSFPIWYGSVELITTFYETVFHWKQFIADSPEILHVAKNQPIYHARTIFSTQCQSTLVDLREKVSEFPFLVSKDNYKKTQSLGLRLSHDGLPGLVSYSARYDKGTNIAVFNKKALKNPAYQEDYLYQLNPNNTGIVEVLDYKNREIVEVIK